MSIRTEDSLNCPCNGIYKCGLHSVPKFIFKFPYPVNENHGIPFETNKFVSPCITKPFPEIVSDWWQPYIAFLDSKEYD